MKGFFSSNEIKSIPLQNGKTTSCVSCGLHKFVLSPRMTPFGKFHKGILNLGEAPGETEDKRGKQWQGKSGRLLQRTYNHIS